MIDRDITLIQKEQYLLNSNDSSQLANEMDEMTSEGNYQFGEQLSDQEGKQDGEEIKTDQAEGHEPLDNKKDGEEPLEMESQEAEPQEGEP